MARHEPANAALYFRVCKPIARLAGRRTNVLNMSLGLAEKACQLRPTEASYAAELAAQQLMLGNLSAASATLRRAGGLAEGSQEVLQTHVLCLLHCGELEEASGQLEFIGEIQTSLEQTAELAYCRALLAQKMQAPAEDVVRLLDATLELHMKALRGAPLDHGYFVRLNPDFMLELGRQYLKYAPAEPEVLDARSAAALILSKASKLLELLVRKAPGLLDAHLLLAQAKYLGADFDAALRACAACCKADPSFAAASLLHAQILLRTGAGAQAHGVLEQAVAHNFAVREAPLYHLVKATVLREQGELNEAHSLLEQAVALPGVGIGAPPARGRPEVPVGERCALYLELAEVRLALGKTKEANRLMRDVVVEFSGTPQEGRVTIAVAKVELSKGQVEKALSMLRDVPADNAHHHAARQALAELYLSHRNDRRMFAQCHEEMVKANPTAQAYILLGEAYMRIVEPEKAIGAFESALQRTPGDASLASRIGKVLVTTHDYAKAIQYYASATQRDPSKTALRLELAQLFAELKRHEQATAEVKPLLLPDGDDGASGELEGVITHVQALRLMARVHKEGGALGEAVAALERARQATSNILARTRIEAAEREEEQQEAAAELCLEAGRHHELNHDAAGALDAYEAALKHHDAHEGAMLALARLQLTRGEVDAAQALATQLMTLHPANERASLVLADVMLQKSEWDAAIYHFEQRLEKAPTSYVSLATLFKLLRRAGRIKEARPWLMRAERHSSHAVLDAGYRFCDGLLHRYLNAPGDALASLNRARRDAEWGEQALQHMVEIFLNPENETNWDELELASRAEHSDAAVAVETLLREMRPSPRHAVLEAYALMAQKTKASIEQAASKLLELLNSEKEFVPALVCLSQAYLMIKQAPKARNYLKRVAKMGFIAELADDFEKGWLMLADVYIVSGKYDLAEELCRKCLQTNKSCAKAWEFLGVVKEKEMSYVNAASHYESAWQFENEASATVGYKLSFNYLKAKKYVEAIDVCHKVLKQYPDYPKIRKDVLEKARMALKP